ncbi:uncharacterized protein EDB91DRAFT_1087854 [Suillus paluster]|uniref:uncharacterized protein n=1 Tax=Suillus paluster TaxID=48578 RepID=UPI001B8750F5|nr:uncharacterized protein EDB91DRAFT_1087854 [Suillus paluster]KAG1723308.1 hypothetical protein EDB91DRAFT_1087854 [Suillus paluster]
MKITPSTPVQKSYRVEARGRKGRKRWVKVPLASVMKHASRVRTITLGNGCQSRNHISITSSIKKLPQQIGGAPSVIRMGYTNVKIVLGSLCIARAAAGVDIDAIPSTGSVSGMGKQCPVLMDKWDLFQEDESDDHIEPEDLPSVSGPEFQPKDNTMVIVNSLFAASFNRPKTLFTFSILDDFLLDNLESSANDLEHISTPHAGRGQSIPSKDVYTHRGRGQDQYRELMRVSQQWRHLKNMKWHGFGHHSNHCEPGDLALFCPACPQPGINLSLTTEESLDEMRILTTSSWKYTRSFVMDGNFKVEHLHPINPDDEVWLSDGFGFMVGKDRFSERREMNMDYALCEAASYNMKGITRAVTFYDINCQYNKLWHIHGHQDSCYVRYASNFIEGIGRINGEIMETLWASLNLISPSTQGMSSPHRKECLDFQMNDSNFCKMICMKRMLCWKFKGAKHGIAESGKAFDRLDEGAPESSKTVWLASERVAQSSRIHDPAVMDIYEINIWKAPSKKEIELRLLEENDACHASPSRRSVATWISMGLAIEEAQIALLIEVQRLGQRPTETQRLNIARQRDWVQGQIDGFTQSALLHSGDGFNSDEDPEDLSCAILDDLDNGPDEFTETLNTYRNTPELTVIPLPSNVGLDRLQHCLAEDLIPLEMSLHEGQANDALHNLRIHLCNKAVLFRTTIRQAKSQALKTRAWSQDKEANDETWSGAAPASEIPNLCSKNSSRSALQSVIQMPEVSGTSPLPGSCLSTSIYRGQALRDQWIEELTVVELEMDWTCNFFSCKAAQLDAHMRESSDSQLQGHASYVARQSRMYSLLAQDVQAAFQDLTMMPIYPEDE